MEFMVLDFYKLELNTELKKFNAQDVFVDII